MIAKISGKLLEKLPTSIIVQTGGIGFEILISSRTYEKLPDVGKEVFLDIYTHVREEELKLVGFLNLKEKELFLKLLNVSGISIKIALSAFSIYGADELTRIIVSREVDLVRRVPGIGKKLAERIILELREKLGEGEIGSGRAVFFEEDKKVLELRQALKALGYSSREIDKAIQKISVEDMKNKKIEEVLKIALRGV
jgi:Holliday junction DNA helicase RuvA